MFKRILLTSWLMVLAACGGAGDSAPGPAPVSHKLQGRMQISSIAAPSGSQWSGLIPLSLVPAAAANLPNGKVLLWSADSRFSFGPGGQTYTSLLDPSTGTATESLISSTGHNMFCPGTSNLPDGRLLINGGSDSGKTSIYDPHTNAWSVAAEMRIPRGYQANTVLEDGSVFTLGGSWSGTVGNKHGEVWTEAAGWRYLSGVPIHTMQTVDPSTTFGGDSHFWLFTAGNGRVFRAGPGVNMHWISTQGEGSVEAIGPRGDDEYSVNGNAVMYDVGKILKVGGAPAYEGGYANANSYVIDINNGVEVRKITSMAYPRVFHNSVVLPNGQVVIVGGQTYAAAFSDDNAVLRPELFDPVTETFTLLPPIAVARNYHSVALLLPDARVMSAGGGLCGVGCAANHPDLQILTPHYLFNADGSLATRPVIIEAPAAAIHGTRINVRTDSPVTSFSLVRVSSNTHAVNTDQRRIPLDIATSTGNDFQLDIPANPGVVVPGYYMLFAMNADGVPSVAATVQISGVGAPKIVNPGDQSNLLNAAVTLALSIEGASSVSATGLPAGVLIDPQTKVVSGAPTEAGRFRIKVSAANAVATTSTEFLWEVNATEPMTLDPVLARPAAAGSTVTLTVLGSGTSGARYRWNFGDGTPETASSTSSSITHTYSFAGLYSATVTVTDARGEVTTQRFTQAIHAPTAGPARPVHSSNMAFETRTGANARVWLVNQDNDSISVFDAQTYVRQAEIPVGTAPRSVAIAPDGRIWVTNKGSANISVISPLSLSVVQTVPLARASMPFGIVFAPNRSGAFVVLEALGQLVMLNPVSGAVIGRMGVGENPRHLSMTAASDRVLVSRFVSPPLPGESTAEVQTAVGGLQRGGEVVMASAAAVRTIVLQHSDLADSPTQGRGIPNYLAAAVISPSGDSAWVPSKQDNIKRGSLRDGNHLDFQNTVRAVTSRIDMATLTEDAQARIDHDNAGLASAAVFHPTGAYLFVALQTSRSVAVVDPVRKIEILRFDVGRAPDGLAVSPDGLRLYVNNFMERSMSVFDLSPLTNFGVRVAPLLALVSTVKTEKLPPRVLRGKQLFYDAHEPRLAREGYLSCASCHNDGGHDGRVWDLSGAGEGLRNTISLRGRGGSQGFLHWSGNFDEVQDFEGQIRGLSGGSGLMSNAHFNTGTRSLALGTPKAAVSADLDSLALYVRSLNAFDVSPNRPSASSLSADAIAGKTLFASMNCASCHSGAAFTNSGANTLSNIGTIKQPGSGQRLGGVLAGIDVPTLRDVWATAPYLHDGSAATLGQAVRAHKDVTISDANLAYLVAYLREIGSDEDAAPVPAVNGLVGAYFNNTTLSGNAVLTRAEAINFNWGTAAAGAAVNADNFSARWTGSFTVDTGGTYRLQTYSDEGVRVWVNGTLVINNWIDHTPTFNSTGNGTLVAGQRYSIRVEYYDKTGNALMQLRWLTPGATAYVPVPISNLFPN